MVFLRWVLRVYSWIFVALLCLAGIGVSIVSLTVGASDPVKIPWLPWSENVLPTWLIALGILGLLFVLLAIMGRLRVLLFLFTAIIFGLIAKGLFFSTHTFEGPDEGKTALYMVIAAFVAFIGAWPTAPRSRNYRSR